MYLSPKERKELIIAPSKNGQGIFVQKAFKNEENIFEFKGSFISGDVDEEIDDNIRSNTIRFDEDWYISPDGRIGDFLNHSCNPTAKVVKVDNRLFIRAIKNIAIRKEVTIDYSTVTASDDIWKMKCLCGSSMCRGRIGTFKALPALLKGKYIEQSIVPEYILEIG